MADSEARSESNPAPAGGSSASSPPSSGPFSWLQPVVGLVLAGVVVVRLVPLLDKFLTLAAETERELKKLGQSAGWSVWIPSIVIGAILFGVVVPTGFRDIAQLAGVVKGWLPGKGDKG